MRALMGATSLVMLGLSPWIIPSIAAAAKVIHDEARDACRNELGENRSDDRRNARINARARDRQALYECGEAKLAGKTWP